MAKPASYGRITIRITPEGGARMASISEAHPGTTEIGIAASFADVVRGWTVGERTDIMG